MLLALITAAEEEQHGPEEATNPILPFLPEMLYGVIFFTILYLLVRYVFLPSIQGVRDERARQIQADLDAAEAARAEAANAAAEAQDHLAGARAQAAAIIDEARAEAAAERQRLVSQAESEVATLREGVMAEIDAERTEAMAALQPQVADLAATTASRVMNRPVDSATAASIVNRFLSNPN